MLLYGFGFISKKQRHFWLATDLKRR